MISRVMSIGFFALTVLGNAQTGSGQNDSYDTLLYSRSLNDQRMALTAIVRPS